MTRNIQRKRQQTMKKNNKDDIFTAHAQIE
jgi:hypothetical protein